MHASVLERDVDCLGSKDCTAGRRNVLETINGLRRNRKQGLMHGKSSQPVGNIWDLRVRGQAPTISAPVQLRGIQFDLVLKNSAREEQPSNVEDACNPLPNG